MARVKSGLDPAPLLALKVEDADVDLSRAPVSLGSGQRIGRGGQPLNLPMQASDNLLGIDPGEKGDRVLGQRMSSFPLCTCNGGVASFDSASVAMSLRSSRGSGAASNCISSQCATATSPRTRAMASSTVSPVRI
jgi:hypothetical protein